MAAAQKIKKTTIMAEKQQTTAAAAEQPDETAETTITTTTTTTIPSKNWNVESYDYQSRHIWPGRGQHILAQYDEDSIVVYQAFRKEIAEYVCQHQTFEGCPFYNPKRMTWIKTNFLWMMFRSHWATRPNQERIVAIWIKQDAFDRYLECAREKGSVRGSQGTVRLQWDPDHFPNRDRHPYRRAVQLGLRDIETFRNGQDFCNVQDVTEFVCSQRKAAKSKKKKEFQTLVVASERVYEPGSALARESVALSALDGDCSDGSW